MAAIQPGDAAWFKDAVIYELSVRSFYDSNSDGIGDFPGLIQKLDYLEDVGINVLWLLPFYPSPLKDDGYDVTDHCNIHPDYGTLTDFKQFLKEAHRRGIRVITELILNHTSDQHPWFIKSRKARSGTRFREMYVWSDKPDKFKEARIMFNDAERSNWSWDVEARAYYWHRFYRHQPKLNLENPEVQVDLFKIVDFWLKMGVDGFRLSSIPFLFEEDGTSCENLPQTHSFIRKLRSHIDKNYKERILIAEANLWPDEAVTYFGNGDECHMNFNFPLTPRLFLALRTEDSFPIIDIIEQTPPIPPTCQWALFLRNHDELGLEMVTEEEKHFLFKAYAFDAQTKVNTGIRRRLASLLNNDRRKIELLYALLFSLPGTPVIYYGDEIGMGDNVYLGDRLGIRTPMQWNMNQNAGFSGANPQRLYLPVITDPVYRYESVNVATQEENSSSLFWWVKNMLAMRKRLQLFGRGDMKFIESDNNKILCFVRTWERQHIAVVVNLSQFSQSATLDLSAYKEFDITEVFSQNRFNKVTSGYYPVTMGPYGYFWFQLDREEERGKASTGGELPTIKTNVSWERLLDNYNEVRTMERKVIPLFLKKCRWFGGKAKMITKTQVDRAIPLKIEGDTHFLCTIKVHYAQQLPEYYFVPMMFALSDFDVERIEYTAQSVVCRAEIQGETGFIMDSSYDRVYRDFLFNAMKKDLSIKDDNGGVLTFNSSTFTKIDESRQVQSKILKADQSNTAIIYNDKYFFKFYRKIEKEINPDLEIVRFLSEHTTFRNSPRYAGGIEYHDEDGKDIVLGLLQEKVDNQGDAWIMAVDEVGKFYEAILAASEALPAHPPLLDKPSIKVEEAPDVIQKYVGKDMYDRMVLLGQRTAEMHLALASGGPDSDFGVEAFNPNYQRSLYSSLRRLLRERFALLESSLQKLRPDVQAYAKKVLSQEQEILSLFSNIYNIRINALKTRIHGDFHLGQVLFTGKDFVIIDFEGEPGFSFSERRLRKNPMKDVAGLMRSLHYAAYGKILLNERYSTNDRQVLESWAEQWQHYVSRFFLGAYMEKMEIGRSLSKEREILLQTFLMEKAVYELGYELNGRPDWTIIPLRGISYLIDRYKETSSTKQKAES